MEDPTLAEPIAAVAKFQVLSILHDRFHVPRALHDGLLNAITRDDFFSAQTQHGGGLVLRDKMAPATEDEVNMLSELCQFTIQLARSEAILNARCV
jgi:hypothetical protein